MSSRVTTGTVIHLWLPDNAVRVRCGVQPHHTLVACQTTESERTTGSKTCWTQYRGPATRTGPPAASPPNNSRRIRPAVLPSCRASASMNAVLDYLCSGVRSGMNVPDAADSSLQTVRVLA